MNVIDYKQGNDWTFYNADCVDVMSHIPDNSIDHMVFSPPYSELYVYSESIADMGNVDDDDQFFQQYRFAVDQMYRILRPGRICAAHVKDLVFYQNSSEDGSAGIRPFSDGVIACHLAAGFVLHCRITIWRDPVLERSKCNPHGLLWKTFQKDASFCRVGMPEYLLVFRKWAKPGEEALVRHVKKPKEGVFGTVKPWQELASPVWPVDDDMSAGSPVETVWNWRPGQSGRGDFDLPATDVLNVDVAKDQNAEKHLCPMPMNITSRSIELWTNKGDVILSPFGGIASEGVTALRKGRKFIGIELHPKYWAQGCKFLAQQEKSGEQIAMF